MAKELLTINNTAFFSCASDSYIYRAAVSLLSIRKTLPNARLYILSKYISDNNKRFLNKHSIQYIELDLTYLFFQIWQYPIECYYIFAGPELFYKLGFQYCVYIDGDTLCMKNPIKNIPQIHDIAGVTANTFDELFGPEGCKIASHFHIPNELFYTPRIQSGILYMNNAALKKIHFLNKSATLYYDSWKIGHPRKGDDSLLALFLLVNHNSLKPTILNNDYNCMPHFQGFSTRPTTVFFHFTIDKPWKYHPYQHESHRHDIFNPYTKAWRNLSRKASITRWLNSLSFPTKCKSLINKTRLDYRQRLFILKGLRYSNRRKKSNSLKRPIKLYWWQPPQINNFGDVVSQDIISNIFGRKTVWAPIETCDLIATGSIIEIAKNAKRHTTMNAWGSGFIKADSGNNGLKKINFSAVRGRRTLARIKDELPTGDPGMLINATYLLKKKRHSNTIGVIIHYSDMKTPIAKRFCEDPRFTVITPLDSPLNVAKKISECKLILSSSLHGLIFADSLSIPNAHIKVSNNLTGGTYKFIDYCSGVGKAYHPANTKQIFNNSYLNQLIKEYEPIHNLTKKQKDLINSFPFN